MKFFKFYKVIVLSCLLAFFQFSCIDRNTIAGTGKELPDSIIGAGGNFQSGAIRTRLPIPLKVRILASNERPVRGVVVEFSNPPGLVSFSDTLVASDGDGYASTFATLGNIADSIKIYATVLGLKGSPIIFTVVSRASTEASAEKVSGDLQFGIVTSTLGIPLKVKILDPFGNPVKNVVSIFSTTNGSFANPVVQSEGSGIASSVWTLDSLIGTKSATVSFPTMPNVSLQFSATATALNPVSMFAVSSDTIHSLRGAQLPGGIQVKMVDKYGNPTTGYEIQFSAVSGSPQISSPNSTTRATGIASTDVTVSITDSITKIQATAPQYAFTPIVFIIYGYIYLQIDSLRSSNGTVELFWAQNLNSNFLSYSLERCSSFTFDQSTVVVATITDPNITSVIDNSVTTGTSPYYRIKVNYLNNFYFYTNIRQITVNP